MKLTTNRTVENNLGGIETHHVSIAANGKAFSTLVKGIYENKVRAFVREISTNALDSHIEAGIPEMPFHVSFPDQFDPYFRVRDYGVSMTHEQVFAIFGTLFESTKDQSNDVVGAFGLGSKSPLAYADSFNVTAFLDGDMRIYIVTIDESGAPTISLIAQEETDKPDGIEVAVPIREHDFQRVINEGRSVLSAFDVVPTNNIGIEPMKRFAELADGSAFIIKDQGSGIFVRQGCVMYPVTDWGIIHNASGNNISYTYKLVVNVPIGTYGVTTSREALELDEATRKDVSERIADAIKKIGDNINAKFNDAPNFLEATKLLVDDNVDGFWSGGVSYKGKRLTGWVSLNQDKQLRGKAAIKWNLEMNPSVRCGNKRKHATLNTLELRNVYRYMFIVERSNVKVPRAALRYREAVAANGQDYTYLLTDPSPKMLSRLQRLLGLKGSQIVSIASLPDPGKVERGEKRSNTNTKVSGVTTVNHSNNIVEELPEDYYWMEMSRPNRWDRDHAASLFNKVIKFGGKQLPMLIFSPTAVKRYKPSEDMHVREAYKSLLEAGREQIAEDYKVFMASTGLGHNIAKLMGYSFKDESYIVDKAQAVFDRDELIALDSESEILRGEWKRRFPLLIDPTESDWEDYISSQSENSKG